MYSDGEQYTSNTIYLDNLLVDVQPKRLYTETFSKMEISVLLSRNVVMRKENPLELKRCVYLNDKGFIPMQAFGSEMYRLL